MSPTAIAPAQGRARRVGGTRDRRSRDRALRRRAASRERIRRTARAGRVHRRYRFRRGRLRRPAGARPRAHPLRRARDKSGSRSSRRATFMAWSSPATSTTNRSRSTHPPPPRIAARCHAPRARPVPRPLSNGDCRFSRFLILLRLLYAASNLASNPSNASTVPRRHGMPLDQLLGAGPGLGLR